MSQAMVNSQLIFAEDMSQAMVNNTLIFELTDCGYKEVLASEDRDKYYMLLHRHSQMKDKQRREAVEQKKTQDAKRAEKARREAVRLHELTDGEHPLLITALGTIADMAEPGASITSVVSHIEVLSHWDSNHGHRTSGPQH